MSLNEAEAVLDPVADIDGFLLGCLVDASTGMILAAHKDQDDISLPTGAAGAADIANVLSLLAGELRTDGLEDIMVTFRSQLYVIRLISENLEPNILTMTDVYRLLVLRLLSVAGAVPEQRLAVMSFVRAASGKKGDTMPVIEVGTAAGDDL